MLNTDANCGLGTNGDGRYRILCETDTVRALVHHGLPEAIRTGGEIAEDATRKGAEALQRWICMGLPHLQTGNERRFDLYEVLNFMVKAGRNHGDHWYREGPVATFRRAAKGLAEVVGPKRFQVRFRRDFCLRPGGPVRLRVPLPLEDAAVSELSATLTEPDPTSVVASQSAGRLEIRLPGAELPRVISVEVDIQFTWKQMSLQIDDALLQPWDTTTGEYLLYTQSSEGLLKVTSPIVELAESLAQGSRNVWETIKRFRDFFFEQMNSGRIHHDELDQKNMLVSLLKRGWFDCLTGSTLMAALCRSKGIPARIANGITLYDAIPANHYWLEVLLPPYGWVPIDLASWDLAGGRKAESPWNDYYLGSIDPRMVYQRFPRQILGPIGVPFPACWYMLSTVVEGGLETTFFALDGGAMLYRDTIRVTRENHERQAPPKV